MLSPSSSSSLIGSPAGLIALRRRGSLEAKRSRSRERATSPPPPGGLRNRSRERPTTPPSNERPSPPSTPPSPGARSPPRRRPHFALPPPSGYDLSDDVDSSSEGSDEGETAARREGEDAGDDDDDETHDRHVVETEEEVDVVDDEETMSPRDWMASEQRTRAAAAVADDPHVMIDEDHEGATPWGPLVDADADAAVGSPFDDAVTKSSGDSPPASSSMAPNGSGPEREELSALERIFVFSKSEFREHRCVKAHSVKEKQGRNDFFDFACPASCL